MANNKLTIKEAILIVLEEEKKALTYTEIFDLILKKNLYDFGTAKTPKDTVSAQLGWFIRHNDSRVKRVKQKNGFVYYLSKFESEIELNAISEEDSKKQSKRSKKDFEERDLHLLLSSFLKNQGIATKTIFHEKSSNSKDSHQKWIHPDMVGVKFLNLKMKASNSLLKITNQSDTYKIYSYELKKEVNTDYDLKKSYFQAVSNSSWANYGYLVAFTINSSLIDEIERLNESFGIGIIELKANPFESKILFPAKHNELDFKTIDKLCRINEDFNHFIEDIEKLLTASEKYLPATKKEFINNCDSFLEKDSEIKKYCSEKHIPYEDDEKTV
jgi:hypothetical protein